MRCIVIQMNCRLFTGHIISKQYNRALAVYDSLLPVWRERRTMQGYLESLHDKSDVVFESGRDRAASLAYKEYAFLNDSLSQVRFYQELAEMKTPVSYTHLDVYKRQGSQCSFPEFQYGSR